MAFLYFFYTPSPDFYDIFALKISHSLHYISALNNSSCRKAANRSMTGIRRWIVSAGLIAGVVLVFMLLGYLIYALINAEAF